MAKPLIQLLINGEEFLALRHLARVEKQLIDPSLKDFNYQRLSARDVSGAQLVDLLKTLPMMADTRLVVLTDLESFKKQDLEVLGKYFDAPCDTTHFIMMATKIDKRTSFYKNFIKAGEVFEFKPLYANQIPQFISKECQTMGLGIGPGCAERLSDVVGTNLMSILSELEKLSLYVWPDKKISLKHVNELVSAGVIENIFKITDYISQKNIYEAQVLYTKMREQGEPVIRTMALVISHFRKLLLIKACLQKQMGQHQLSSQLGINPYFLKTYLAQSRQFEMNGLKKIYEKAMTTSYQLRTVNLSAHTLFEGFLQEVCVGM